MVGNWSLFLFIGAIISVTRNSIQKKPNLIENTPTIQHIPNNGLYWNDYKITDYPVPLFLHYYFKMKATIPITIFIDASDASEEFLMVEFYINNLIKYTVEGPGPQYAFSYNVTITPFHHSPTFGIKGYLEDGEVISDNVTIYRLFP